MKTSDFNDRGFLFFLSRIKGLGSRQILSLLKTYKTMAAIRAAALADSDKNARLLMLIHTHLLDDGFTRQTTKEFAGIGAEFLTILDHDYPPLLKNIYDPPLFIYYRGNKELLRSEYLFTIVGSRTLSAYHQSALRQIIGALASTPLVIVSGLALGIDGYSHRLALINKLPTVAVLGSGLDKNSLYPAAHRSLAEDIVAKGGLLVSEHRHHSAVLPHNFPRRNRILAGLAQATLVISGAQKSGTLITAQVALDEGREVLALPGNINTTLNWGPNQLIKNGAATITEADDILKIYGFKTAAKPTTSVALSNPLEKQLYDLIKLMALTPEELSQKTKQPLPQVQSALVQLELKNLIKTNLYNQLEIA